MAISYWARRRSYAIFLSVPALTHSALPPVGVRVWHWPNGCTRASRRMICGAWTSVASVARTSIPTGCAAAPWKPTANTTPLPGPLRSTARVGRPVARRCMTLWPSRVPVLVKSSAGSGPTGLPNNQPVKSRRMFTALNNPTGRRRWRANTTLYATPRYSSIRHRLPSLYSKGLTRWPR